MIAREDRRTLSFGAGRHACPGEALAKAIAVAGLGALLGAGVDPERLAEDWVFLPSGSARVPLFGGGSIYA